MVGKLEGFGSGQWQNRDEARRHVIAALSLGVLKPLQYGARVGTGIICAVWEHKLSFPDIPGLLFLQNCTLVSV